MQKTLIVLTLISTLMLTSCGGGGGGTGGGNPTQVTGTMYNHSEVLTTNSVCVSKTQGSRGSHKKHQIPDYGAECTKAGGKVVNTYGAGYEKDTCTLSSGLVLICSQPNGDCSDNLHVDACISEGGSYSQKYGDINVITVQECNGHDGSFEDPTCENSDGMTVDYIHSISSELVNNLKVGSNFIVVQDLNTYDWRDSHGSLVNFSIGNLLSITFKVRISGSWEAIVERNTSQSFTSFVKNDELLHGFTVNLPFSSNLMVDETKLFFEKMSQFN